MAQPWQVLSSRLLLDRPWLKVRGERVQTGRGAIIEEFHVIESPAWVAAITTTTEKELVLVRQYRHGHGAASLELPAGVIDAQEDVLAAAQRELREETGFQATGWQPLWKTRPEPARHEQWAHFVVGRDAERRLDQELDATEDMEVVLWPLSAFNQLLGEISHGLHVGALLLAKHRGLLA